MEIEGAAVDSAIRIAQLEAKCGRLDGEKARLMEEMIGLKEKYRKWKDRCVEMKEKFDSEKSKWREEKWKIWDECSQAVLEKKLTDIDLKDTEAKFEKLTSLLEERDRSVACLSEKIEALERRNSELVSHLEAAKMRSQELEKASIPVLLQNRSFSEEEKGSDVVMERERREIKEELIVESVSVNTNSASLESSHKQAMGNANSENSAVSLNCKKSSDISHNEPQKESLDQADMQLNGYIGQAVSSKMLGKRKELPIAAKQKASDNGQTIVIRTEKGLENLSHKGIESTPLAASQSIAGSPGNSAVPKRRKLEPLGFSVDKHTGTKQCKSGGRSDGKLKWESASRMFNAFNNDELCMRAVCALYRQHKSLGPWKNCSPLGNIGFKPQHETRGVDLGKLLTDGDPEGRMKKPLVELKRADREECRFIARHHCAELFQIYKNNWDPLFMPDETI